MEEQLASVNCPAICTAAFLEVFLCFFTVILHVGGRGDSRAEESEEHACQALALAKRY